MTPNPKTRTKTCKRCGREFSWRKKWRDSWESVLYCSERCRRTRLEEVDRALEEQIVELLGARTGTICPSEAARRVAPDAWRPLMQRTRSAARRLAAEERVAILQGGAPVDPSLAKGPIRIGRGSRFEHD